MEPDANSIYKRILLQSGSGPKGTDLVIEIMASCIMAEALIKLGNSIERAAEKLNETIKGE